MITPEIRKEPPPFSLDKSRGGGGTPCINAREHEGGAMHLDRAKCDLRGLEGEGGISLISGEDIEHLPALEDPGGVPQHSRGGYQPRASTRPVPGTPRKGGTNAMSMKR